MFGDKIDKEDEHWECFLLLWDICSYTCRFGVTQEDSIHLAWIVQTYLEAFLDLYGEKSITPKLHHLVHLPEQIQLWVENFSELFSTWIDTLFYSSIYILGLAPWDTSGVWGLSQKMLK